MSVTRIFDRRPKRAREEIARYTSMLRPVTLLTLALAAACRPAGPVLDGPAKIRIEENGDESLWTVRDNATVFISGESYRVTAIRPWAGLMRGATGSPMTQISVAIGDEWIEDNVLAADAWAQIGDSVAVTFRWHADEAAMAAAVAAPFDPADGARWGIRDGANVQWLNTFVPGVGAKTGDGTEVTLLGVERLDDKPALRVSINRDGDKSEKTVTPTEDDEAFVVFDVPRLRAYVVYVDAWREGAATIRVHASTAPAQTAALRDGETWTSEESGIAVRLEAMLASASLVSPSESPYYELVLDGPERRYRLREGESGRIGEARVQFYYDPDA